MALLLPREIDVSIDKIQVSSLPPDHPLPEEAVLSMCLEKSGKDSKLFKKECILKKTASMDSSHGKNIITFLGITIKLSAARINSRFGSASD